MAGHVHRRTNLGAIPVLGPWMVDPCCRVCANQRRELTAACDSYSLLLIKNCQFVFSVAYSVYSSTSTTPVRILTVDQKQCGGDVTDLKYNVLVLYSTDWYHALTMKVVLLCLLQHLLGS